MHRVMGIQRTRRAVPPKTGSAYLHGPSQPESAGPEQAQRPAAAPFRPPDLARSARQNRGPKGKSSRLCSEQGEARITPKCFVAHEATPPEEFDPNLYPLHRRRQTRHSSGLTRLLPGAWGGCQHNQQCG
jgi:hypothetical protein